MSAIPQKKLCWQCDGNVSKDIDNCPYCGVYLHETGLEDDSSWNPSYSPSSLPSPEIPSPIYPLQIDEKTDLKKEGSEKSLGWLLLGKQLKQDLLPLLFLMAGSLFFLFGFVLLLFSQNGTLTLQWQSRDAFYFLFFSLPLMGLGWKFFQQLDSN